MKINGERNVIAVKVDNSLMINCRWYTDSGINRNARLIISEKQHINSLGTFFRTISADGNVARIKVDCEVISNKYPESQNINFQQFPDAWKKVARDAGIVALLKEKDGNVVDETVGLLPTMRPKEKGTISAQCSTKGSKPVKMDIENSVANGLK